MGMTLLGYQHSLRATVVIMRFVIARLTGLKILVIPFGAIVILTNLLPGYD